MFKSIETVRKSTFKPTTNENLVIFVMKKIGIKYRKIKGGLYLAKYNSSFKFCLNNIMKSNNIFY